MMRVAKARGNLGERGAAAVEMAIVVPVLVLLAFGMLEFGLAFKNKLDMSHAVNQSTRNATVLGTDAVRSSHPSAVTSTSSSSRMPMPRHFRATLLFCGDT